MDVKKKVSKAEVIMYCVNAIGWNIIWLLDLSYGNTNSASFVWHIVFAIGWDIHAVVRILLYRKSREDNIAS